ncbi:MAG: hypothetical protein K8R18_13000 [Parvibaculum sp.]|uniref:hypothetical protein n=1 Tax=Parvibaculum sp. TaxID=2024848 RepID=UPI0025EDA0B3|nr:hypothetical protein [Parvibaculum sp.]MCE9650533.1 hypothetical protein [Parvibaculum sp.]
MMNNEVTLARLAEIVDAYGASAHRWPVAERRSAEILVLNNPQAQALVDEARNLDFVLDAAPDGVVSEALVSRIMAARPRGVPANAAKTVSERPNAVWLRTLVQAVWPYGSPAFPAGALAASVVLGIGLGLTSPVAVSALGLSSGTTTVASATTTAASDQLLAFALAENEYPEDWKK